MNFDPPLVLALGGLDPSGAGLQADIEACLALGCHALPVATSVTVQNTRSVASVIALDPADIVRQAEHLLKDVRAVAACKIGFLPNVGSVHAVKSIIDALPIGIPICLDPVIRAGSGENLSQPTVISAIVEHILPRATLIKPNLYEARVLTNSGDAVSAGRLLSSGGCHYALLTAADEGTTHARHFFYRDGALLAEYEWPRLVGAYHGTGCTLTSSIAAFLARGCSPEISVSRALCYTFATITHAKSIGGSQLIPNRLIAGQAGDDV